MAAKRRFVGLDGLKGIALIAIVLYHCDELSLQGGFFGVDVFFTISGFLIFSSLLNRIDSGKGLELGEYFLKRFRRIYPALFALIPISVTLAWLVNRDMLVGIRNQIMTVLLGCYNWYAISSGASYFSQMNPDLTPPPGAAPQFGFPTYDHFFLVIWLAQGYHKKSEKTGE